jgi:hypothetical protein
MCDKKAGQRRAQQLVSNNFYYTPHTTQSKFLTLTFS